MYKAKRIFNFLNSYNYDKMEGKFWGIPALALWIGAASTSTAIIALVYVYLSVITKISPSELNSEVLGVLASIILPVTFLIFIDITKDKSWRKLRGNKVISVGVAILLFLAIYFMFGAGSISILNSPINIKSVIPLMFASIGICVIILIFLISIYIYIY